MELSKHSENASMIFSKALDAHNANDSDAAQNLYNDVLAIEPDHSEANHNLGIIFFNKNEGEKALALLKKSLDQNPNISLYWASYINTLMQLDRIFEAIVLVEAARTSGLLCNQIESLYRQLELGSTEPNDKVIHQLKILLYKDEFEKVRTACLRLKTVYPNSYWLCVALGQAFIGLKKSKLAITHLLEATEHNPHWAVPLIPLIGPQLTTKNNTVLLKIASQTLDKISEGQFLFILNLVTFKSEFRDEAFSLIKAYVESKGLRRLDLILNCENRLGADILSKFEDQESYAKFYKIFEDFYDMNPVGPATEVSAKATGLLFFVHSPVFLAHTNPLFSILKTKQKTDRVTVASMESDQIFREKCEQLGCKFIELKGSCTLDQLKHLELCGADHQSVIWQCAPLFLSYFSKRLSNVNWWSFKFNPPISGLNKCFSGLPSDSDFMYINGNKWLNFSGPFEMANTNKNPADWLNREGKIGAFCREELIDDEKYWATVSHLLKNRKTLTFQYCGRSPIHKKWVSKFNINPNQVTFLGWLSSPEKEILKVAVILDTYTLRHGLMGREGTIAGIPIICPATENQGGGLDALYCRLPPENALPNPISYSSFETNDSALALVDKLAFNAVENLKVGLQQKELTETLPNSNFQQLLQLL